MRFVKISAIRWIIANPGLEILEKTCHKCETTLVSDKPFIDGEWVGLISDRCNCIGPKSQICSSLTTDPETRAKWASLVEDIKENL